jgi:hypothetical protein
MALGLRYGQRKVNDQLSTGSEAVTIRKRRVGWQVIVYAGLDPLTGRGSVQLPGRAGGHARR